MTQKEIDNNIIKLRKIVKSRQEEIENLSNFTWKTSCSFGFSRDINSRVNIQTINDATILIELFGQLITKKTEWDQSCKVLESGSVKFIWLGYDFESWKADFKNRLGQLDINKKKKGLKDLQGRLDSLMSLDQKRAEELENIAKQIEGMSV